MKKLVSFLLVLSMVMAIAIAPAFAETELKIYMFGEAKNMDKVVEKFMADSGLDIKPNFIFNAVSDHTDKLPLMMGNEEQVDLTFDANWMNLTTMLTQEMYADVSSYFNNDEYPGLKAAFSESYLAQVTNADGSICCIPFTQAANDMQCIFYRADLAEKYGITIDSDDALEAYFKAVQENETNLVAPFGVGGARGMYYLSRDKIAKQKANIFLLEGSANGLDFEVAISEDGKTVLGATTYGDPEEMFANYPAPYNTNTMDDWAITLGSRWHQYTQPDTLTEDDPYNNLFFTGLVAAVEGNISNYESYEKEIAKLEGGKLGMYVYTDGLRNKEPGFFRTYGQTAWNFLCVPYYCKNIDAAMKFIDWIFQSEENHDLFELGIVGEDFELNEKGEYTALDNDKPYFFPGYEMTWNPNFIRVNANLPEDVKGYLAYQNDPTSYESSVLDGFVFNNQSNPELVTATAAQSAVAAEYTFGIWQGAYGEETEAKLAEYHEKAEKAGLEVIRQAVIDQVQAFLDAKNK